MIENADQVKMKEQRIRGSSRNGVWTEAAVERAKSLWCGGVVGLQAMKRHVTPAGTLVEVQGILNRPPLPSQVE